jgi:hypothetical protein
MNAPESERACLVGQFLETFKQYPPRQKAASFNLDEVMRTMTEGAKIDALRSDQRPVAGRSGSLQQP